MIFKVLSFPDPSKYEISNKHGFLSPDPPVLRFSNVYYRPWDSLAARLHHIIAAKAAVQEIDRLPLLDTCRLDGELEYQRAYVILGFLAHALVWHTTPPIETIPPQISEPYLAVCRHLRTKPVLSYAGLVLWNWQLHSGCDFYVEHLSTVISFTGNRGEDAFNNVSALVEYHGGRLVHTLLDAMRLAAAGEEDPVVDALRDATATIVLMSAQLQKLYPNLDAGFFYNTLRPFLAGGKSLPRGMVFQRSDGEEIACKLVGGNAGQSSLFPFLDHVLGIVHEGTEFFEEMRAYMPGKHRDFLIEVFKLPSLRQTVETSSNGKLRAAFDDCLRQLRLWRGKHIAVVSKYIVQPAREAERARGEPETEVYGTGGSALMPFLRRARDETLGA